MEVKEDQQDNIQEIKKLKSENADLENYFKNTIISQFFFDKDLILRKFTPAAMTQFKLSTPDIGRSIHDLINNLRYPSIIENVNSVLKSSEILEKEIQTTDLRWYQMNIIPYIENIGSAPNGVIITFIDISNRIKDLKELEKIIADFEILSSIISHDIKNHLGVMSLSIQMLTESDLKDLEDKEEIKLYLESLNSGVNKINLTINELLDQKEDKNKYVADEEILNIKNILEDVKHVLIKEINDSKSIIKHQISCSEIVFPRRDLRSIIYNLLNNSIKFKSPERKPEIFIKTIEEDDQIIISVKDNGIGIDPSKQKNVFSKFFKIDKSGEGSGVGLYLVNTLVKKSGGKIELESELGVGTEFKVYLKTECKSA
ncbi:ATP-binding protein [Marivirga sp.]|uniref:sensor histidine kinase n=1 Tax=Marivirga sp. TaxID=2018662 RepID=UPI0025E0826E|nr:ATP-binding protein [Marivirga sp.]